MMDISNTLTGLGGTGLSENPLVDRLLERAGQQELLDSLNEVVAVQLISACVSVCSRPGTLSDSQRRIDAPCGIKDVRKGSGPGAARGWEGHARVGSAVAGLTRGLPRGSAGGPTTRRSTRSWSTSRRSSAARAATSSSRPTSAR